jgi:hypothetical protein
MSQIGGDFEFGHLAEKQNRSAAMSIAAASIAVPLLLGDLMMVLMAIASTFMTVPLIRVIYRRGGHLIPTRDRGLVEEIRVWTRESREMSLSWVGVPLAG